MIEFTDEKPKATRTKQSPQRPERKAMPATGIDGVVEHVAAPAKPLPMDAAAYSAALERLGLSHAQAAAIFGFSRQASHQWAKGTSAVPPYIMFLINVALDLGRSEMERIRAEITR